MSYANIVLGLIFMLYIRENRSIFTCLRSFINTKDIIEATCWPISIFGSRANSFNTVNKNSGNQDVAR